MNHTHCPICYEELEVVETTPCIDCGTSEANIEVLKQDIKENYKHDSVNYSLFRAFGKIECILCDLCTLEFMSYDPEYFGFKNTYQLSPEHFQFLETLKEPKIEKDKYCSNCGHRLAFLLFVKQIREINNA